MRPGASFLLVALLATMVLMPSASAEFGPESDDGWPINIHGEELRPPVSPEMLVANPPVNKPGPFTAYPYYPILTAELVRLSLEYPHLVKLTSAGKSGAQLDMWMLEIADFENPDMIPLEQREVVYLDGGTHSNEYSGVYFVTEIAQFLIEEYETNETARWIVENRHTWIVPMVNPDGSHLFGRMNAAWVNVNRNFPGTWGTVDEQVLLNNPGPEPASEPETRVVIKVLDELQPDYVNSIHCCGNLWLHPWGAEHLKGEIGLEDLEMFTRICDEAFMEVRDRCGEIWSTIYPASGTTADEGYHRIGASSWTYEMSGRGRIAPWGQPVIMEDVRWQERESWNGTMHAFLNVHKYGAHPEIIRVEGTANALEVTIENVGWGNLTAGTLRLGDAEAPIGFIGAEPRDPEAPRNTTTVVLEGSFTEGDGTLQVDWTKRIRHATQGSKDVAVTLVETEDGRLVGLLGGSKMDGETDDELAETTPGVPWIAAVTALALVAAVARKRRKTIYR